jgi:hypothetical protein
MSAVNKNVYIRSEELALIPACLISQNESLAKVVIPQYDSEGDIATDGGPSYSFTTCQLRLANTHTSKWLDRYRRSPC